MRSVCAFVMLLLAALPVRAGETLYRIEEVAGGLFYPWSIAFLPDGAMLVTEKMGGVRIIRGGVLAPQPLAGGPAAWQVGNGGLLDIALDPDFAETGHVFIAFSEGAEEANRTALFRARFDGRALVDGAVIFRAAPERLGVEQFGGRIAFLPDRTLLLSVGEAPPHRGRAQDLSSHEGKIVRLTREGAAAQDNPFADKPGARPEVWAIGVRNALGLLVDPRDGTVWAHENGPQGGDELNRIRAGANYGWPVTTHGIDYTNAIISELTEAPGIESPVVDWTPSIAPSGLALYLGDRFPEWRGDLFAGALKGQHLRRIRIADGVAVEQEILLAELQTRIRDVRAGPDGYLYVTTDEPEGRVLRLVPAGG